MSSGVKQSERIMSIDALRGFDMLMIVFVAGFFHNLHRSFDTPLTGFFSNQFTHPAWYGFHFYDIIMPLFYWIIDVKGYRKWTFFLRVIGMNAITAYVLRYLVDFKALAEHVLYGWEQYIPTFYPVLLSIAGFGILYAFLWYMYRNKTFVKV